MVDQKLIFKQPEIGFNSKFVNRLVEFHFKNRLIDFKKLKINLAGKIDINFNKKMENPSQRKDQKLISKKIEKRFEKIID